MPRPGPAHVLRPALRSCRLSKGWWLMTVAGGWPLWDQHKFTSSTLAVSSTMPGFLCLRFAPCSPLSGCVDASLAHAIQHVAVPPASDGGPVLALSAAISFLASYFEAEWTRMAGHRVASSILIGSPQMSGPPVGFARMVVKAVECCKQQPAAMNEGSSLIIRCWQCRPKASAVV